VKSSKVSLGIFTWSPLVMISEPAPNTAPEAAPMPAPLPLPDEVRRRGVVSYPIQPAEAFKTAPQRQMDLLQQVTLLVVVRLIAASQTRQSCAMFRRRLLVKLVLAAHI
jgi:hypothetical protein